jgi:hypothetical protein
VSDHVESISAAWRELGFDPFQNAPEDVRRESARLWAERDRAAEKRRALSTSRSQGSQPTTEAPRSRLYRKESP